MLYNAFCGVKNTQPQSRINNVEVFVPYHCGAALFCVKSKQFLTNFKCIKILFVKTQYIVVKKIQNNIYSKVLVFFQNATITSKNCVIVLTFMALSYIIDT